VNIKLVLKNLKKINPETGTAHTTHKRGHYVGGCRECMADLMTYLVGRAAAGDRAELAVPAPGESGQDSRSAGH
jgi:hypothetical protein